MIDTRDFDLLVQELCSLSGEDPETVVIRALEERRSRLLYRNATRDGGAGLRRLWSQEMRRNRGQPVN